MAKFSEFPYFLLYDYLNPKTEGYGGSLNGYVRGGSTTIVNEIGYWERIYIEVENGALIEHLFKIHSINGDYFTFIHGGITSSYATSDFDSGSNVYVRKDSVLHKYISDRSPTYDNFVNLEKTFVFLGEIHPASDGNWNIIHNGMKNFAKNLVPMNNRNDNLDEFLETYFDKVHHEIYSMQKNLWSLIDAWEVNLKWLNFISDQYGVQIDNDSIDYLGEIPVREWVDTVPYFLKRKGTYNSIYIIWKLFLKNTLNKLRVYEMWHDKDLSNSTDIPLGNFYEVPYEMNYSVIPSGAGGDTSYYNWIAPSGYPDWDGLGDTFATTTSASPSGYVLTPHYTVEIDLSYEPIGNNYIINENILNYLLENWEYTKPVSKFVHYREFISPITDFSNGWRGPYVTEKKAYLNSRFTGSAFITGGVGDTDAIAGAFHQNVASNEWKVYHYLDSSNVIVQCYDNNKQLIYPKKIYIENSERVVVEFDTSVRGYAFVSDLGTIGTNGYIHTQGTSAYYWYPNHDLDNKENIVQCFDEDDEMMIPDEMSFEDSDNMTISFGDPEAFTNSYSPSSNSDDGYSPDASGFYNTQNYVSIGDST